MHPGFFIQVVGQLRRVHQHRLGARILGVQHPQGVGLEATLAVFVQLLMAGGEELHQGIAITCTGFGGTQAVEFKLHRITDAQLAPQAPGQHDQFGIDVRTVQVEHFQADLVELAITAFLWTLMAEHRTDVPELLYLAGTGQAMLQRCAHTGGGAFRTQGQGVAVAVLEGVHLFFDDVGDFADGALEQLGELDDRHADLLVTVVIQQPCHGAFEVAPQRRLLGQDVVHATNGLQGLAHKESLIRSVSHERSALRRPRPFRPPSAGSAFPARPPDCHWSVSATACHRYRSGSAYRRSSPHGLPWLRPDR